MVEQIISTTDIKKLYESFTEEERVQFNDFTGELVDTVRANVNKVKRPPKHFGVNVIMHMKGKSQRLFRAFARCRYNRFRDKLTVDLYRIDELPENDWLDYMNRYNKDTQRLTKVIENEKSKRKDSTYKKRWWRRFRRLFFLSRRTTHF